MRLTFLAVLMAFFTVTPAFADNKNSKKPVINSVQVSGTSIYVYGNKLLKNSKDKVFFATESSSEMMEVPFMEGGDDFLEVILPYEPSAGTYRLGIGKSEKKLLISELITFGSIGADGRDGVDGQDGMDGATGAGGQDGMDGQDGAEGDPGVDGSSCSVAKTAMGSTLSCTDGTMAAIANGLNGVNGRDGVDGINGVNGSNGQDGADGQNGVDGSSCSVVQLEVGARIECTDGSQATVATSGVTIEYPEAIVGSIPPLTLPTGGFVLVNGDGSILANYSGSSLRGPYNYPLGSVFLSLSNDQGTQTVTSSLQGIGQANFFYQSDDCNGQPFLADDFGGTLETAPGSGEYVTGRYIPDETGEPFSLLVNSSSNYGAEGEFTCFQNPVLIQPYFPVEVILPEPPVFIYPITVEQLP